MSQVLTPIERRIYNYLVDYLKRETYQPSIREIGSKFGIRSTKTVTEHLQSLERKGYLDRTPSRSRALKILGLNLSPDTYTVPLYRNAHPNAQEQDVEARYDLDRVFACSADCFLVRASRDAAGLGILEGDLILVEPCVESGAAGLPVYDREGRVELGGPVRGEDGDGASRAPNAVAGDGSSPVRFLGVARAVLRRLPAR
jgi:repressor LexA